MGLYEIPCMVCKTPFQWFSGNGVNQSCPKCQSSYQFSNPTTWVTHTIEETIPKEEKVIQNNNWGWTCPNCKRVHSPIVFGCDNCNKDIK